MMNDDSRINWPGWETVGLIGRGSFGAVYEIQRDVFGDTEKAALKVLSIPQNQSDIDELYSDGYDDESISSTFHSHLKSIVAEYSLMRKMNGSANVVNCDDIKYISHEDGIGWDIFIKMELLTPLHKALPEEIPESMVIDIAKDLCSALDLCQKHNIVHRDIKPQNIFVSENGDYKLGDFGIAKTVEKTMGGTKIGTYKYMAPEVYNNQPYGVSADIYSLGLVLYWLLNEKRMPFMPLPPEKLKAGMDEEAKTRRLSGESLPAPKNGSDELRTIVLKACAYNPADRYTSAKELFDALLSLDYLECDFETDLEKDSIFEKKVGAVDYNNEGDFSFKERELDEMKRLEEEKTRKEAENKAKTEKKPKKKLIVIISVLLVLLSLFSIILFSGSDENLDLANTTTSESVSDSEIVEPSESTAQTTLPSISAGESSTQNTSSAQTDIAMSSKLDDFILKIDNEVYQLPCAIESFTNNGWVFPEYFDDEENLLDNDSSNSTYLSKGSNVLDIDVYNYSGSKKAFIDCPVGRITYDFSGDIQIYLADSFLLNGKTYDEVLTKYGTPYSNEDYDIYTEVVYEKTGADWIYERYTMRFNSETKVVEHINIVNFVKLETVENNNSNIQYLTNYIAPNTLGEDPASFNVSIMGDVYNLPAPVQAFMENGWEIVKTCDVGAGSSVDDTFKMRKNGVIATFGVYNFSDYQVDAKDATIYKINQDVVDNTDLDLILAGNIKIGTPKADAEIVLDNSTAFDKEEDTDSISYIINNRDYLLRVWIFEGKVESIGIFNKTCSYR